jgi:hypothetical protein
MKAIGDFFAYHSQAIINLDAALSHNLSRSGIIQANRKHHRQQATGLHFCGARSDFSSGRDVVSP